jgi:phospholipid/cholesterol/gamma-HCH transport system ATP-binding protein
MIEVIGVNKSFGDAHVLKDLNVTFEQGQVNLIIGGSGSGKSVLAKCIVGLHKVDTGKILFDGRDFAIMSEREKISIRKEIGMLFQASALFDYLTVEENVMFPLSMFTSDSREEKLKRVNSCLDRVELTGKNHLYPSEISGGMKKRVAIARAIAMNPRYLFCDEPNSGLDPKTSIVIDNLIKDITKENNMTTIVITHDMNSVIEIGENISFIYQGNIWWQGDRKEILITDNAEINDFVYASEFMKEIKENLASKR